MQTASAAQWHRQHNGVPPSLSQKCCQEALVTRLPNQLWLISWATTRVCDRSPAMVVGVINVMLGFSICTGAWWNGSGHEAHVRSRSTCTAFSEPHPAIREAGGQHQQVIAPPHILPRHCLACLQKGRGLLVLPGTCVHKGWLGPHPGAWTQGPAGLVTRESCRMHSEQATECNTQAHSLCKSICMRATPPAVKLADSNGEQVAGDGHRLAIEVAAALRLRLPQVASRLRQTVRVFTACTLASRMYTCFAYTHTWLHPCRVLHHSTCHCWAASSTGRADMSPVSAWGTRSTAL